MSRTERLKQPKEKKWDDYKKLLMNVNFDLDEITVNKEEARRLLHQLPQADQDHIRNCMS